MRSISLMIIVQKSYRSSRWIPLWLSWYVAFLLPPFSLMMKYFSDVKPTGSVRERKTHVDTSVAFLLTFYLPVLSCY